MLEGNFSDYLKEFQEKYQEIRKSGRDIYSFGGSARRSIIALPDKDRIEKRDGSIKLTVEDIDHIRKLFPKLSKEKIIELGVFPYKKLNFMDHCQLSNLEELLEQGESLIYTDGVHVH